MLVVTVLAELASKVPEVCLVLPVFSVPSPQPSLLHTCAHNGRYIPVYDNNLPKKLMIVITCMVGGCLIHSLFIPIS